jgi:exodeoxyribonuclease V beta subunit
VTERTWNPLVALEPRRTWLLEASAGTGKTFQIAGLVLRLVAEYGVPIQRILTITFTNAATAELKDRIRKKLVEGHLAVTPGEAPATRDPFVRHLCAQPDRERLRLRLELALRDFDQAAISTIHAFSQRTLRELAFESNQDADLELLKSTASLRERFVDDALARLFAEASADEVALYKKRKFDRASLLRVTEALCGASRYAVRPECPPDPQLGLGVLRALRCRLDALALRLRGEDGALLASDAHHIGKKPDAVTGWCDKVAAWLEADADVEELDRQRRLKRLNAFMALNEAWFRANWSEVVKRGRETTGPLRLDERPWWPLLLELDAAVEAHRSFAPIAFFARTVRDDLERELVRRRLVTFDGMLSRLAESIGRGDAQGEALADRLRKRYDAVLVDEFQDTDAAQWLVMRKAFHGHARLFLIGDPKQAIYAFRGADLDVYLDAARTLASADASLGQSATMRDNYRSDPRAVEAMNVLWREGSRAFDVEDVDYVTVRPQSSDRLVPLGSGFELRWLDARLDGGAEGAPVNQSRMHLAARLAASEALAWLDGKRGALRDEEAGGDTPPRRLRPRDLAVLVQSHDEAALVREALARVGIPAVAAAKRSVFEAPAARWLTAWLDAIGTAGRDREARSAAVTPLVGWTGDELAWALERAETGEVPPIAEGTPPSAPLDWNGWTRRLRAASERWSQHGFARTFDRELVELGVMERVLAMPEGERHATDLRHLFELLHAEERAKRLGPGALADWLVAQRHADAEDREQRLESDAEAVRLVTIHTSKGLEYPVVLLPFAWRARKPIPLDGLPLRARRSDGTYIDVHAPSTAERRQAEQNHLADEAREKLRLLYVALTRARHRTIAWWGPVGSYAPRTTATALGRLVTREDDAVGYAQQTSVDFSQNPAVAWAYVRQRLDALSARSSGTIDWEPAVRPVAQGRWQDPEAAATPLVSWPADRKLPTFSGRYAVTSYSRLAQGAAAHDPDERIRASDVVTRAAEDAVTAGTPGFAEPSATTVEAASPRGEGIDPPSLIPPTLETYPDDERLRAGRGTAFGTFVHEVFEDLDFAAGASSKPGSEDLLPLVTAKARRHGFTETSAEVLEVAAMLPRILATPLDSHATGARIALPDGFTLAHVRRADRLDELTFDLRLGHGTRFTRSHEAPDRPLGPLDRMEGCVDARRVYEALRKETSVGGLGPWLEHQRRREDEGAPLIGSLAGVLTGSIDLAFRVEVEGRKRYFLADYKTNRIETCAPGHFTGPWLDWKMASTGYVLQSLLYTVALHRHLTVRLGDAYRYERDFGGVLYLFVRGMSGATTNRCATSGHCLGVHGHRWSPEVVLTLDEALDGREGMR